MSIRDTKEKIQQIGHVMGEIFHFLALFVIGSTIVWAAVAEYLLIMQKGHAGLKDILLLFIYLELGAMVAIYFKTHKLPVQFLIYIAITALSRHLVIDVQKVNDNFHLYLLVTIAGAILVLSVAILILTFTDRKYGCPEED
ncbi:phosphate starvation-inducible protein PhoH [Candidatus Thiomargarita nelsonii]|uniref:Protein PsiE n=1 Tax=Candidatus Thiomargarita nelsonii TaxID=1003181 RepID=A0A4E0QT27_9GAMM|nr:phosphate starvation-inducible protein PhoH [Candidatus Thiomargarita nelsonii]